MLSALAQSFGITYSYNYSTGGNSTASSSSGLPHFFVVLLPVFAVLAIVTIVAMWRLFQKAGRPGWAAIIPIYNSWVLFEVSGKPGWWALVSIVANFIPFVGWIVTVVLYILAALELAKRFGKSISFAVLGLIIFSFVGFWILGFGKDQYQAVPDGDGGAGGVAGPPLPPTTPSQFVGPASPAQTPPPQQTPPQPPATPPAPPVQ